MLTWTLPGSGVICCYHQPGQGRPLLLLHSINAAPSAYEVAPIFENPPLGRPLYAPDLPGFGRSARPDRVYSPEFYAQAIIEMIDEIGAGAVDVLALSTTSEFAARAAFTAPERIASLTLVSPTGFTRRREEPSTVGDKVLRFLQAPALGPGLFRLLRSRPSVGFFLDKAFRDKAPEAMIDYACMTASQPGASVAPFHFLSGQFFSHDAVGCIYEHVEQPVLVLYDKDPNIGFRFLAPFVEAHGNWNLVRIPDTFGLPHFDEPLQTRDAIETFLTDPMPGTDQ